MNTDDLVPEETVDPDFPYRSTNWQAALVAVAIIVLFIFAESVVEHIRKVFPDPLPAISFTFGQ